MDEVERKAMLIYGVPTHIWYFQRMAIKLNFYLFIYFKLLQSWEMVVVVPHLLSVVEKSFPTFSCTPELNGTFSFSLFSFSLVFVHFFFYYHFCFCVPFFAVTGFHFSANGCAQLKKVTFTTNADRLLKPQNV